MTFNADNDEDGYFNDLSRQPQFQSQDSNSPLEQNGTDATGEENGTAKTKRIACVVCRKRKLKCNGEKPKCATCARLGHNCAYDEVRRKSGPKRGYVKDLEARLGWYTLSFLTPEHWTDVVYPAQRKWREGSRLKINQSPRTRMNLISMDSWKPCSSLQSQWVCKQGCSNQCLVYPMIPCQPMTLLCYL